MKYKWITALITAGLLGSGTLMAEEEKKRGKGPGKGRPGGEEMRKKLLEQFDKDGDGKLSESEREAAKGAMQKRGAEMFSKADKNGDGKISKDEVPEQVWARMSKADKNDDGAVTKEELAAARAAGGGKGGPGRSGGRGNPMEQFDKNGDGKIAKDEVPEQVWSKLSQADKNGDGVVSKDELPKQGAGGPGGKSGKPGKGGRGGGNPISHFDKDNDGKLSKEEVPAEVWARMSKADKNADGFVSASELEAAHKQGPGGGEKKKKEPSDS